MMGLRVIIVMALVFAVNHLFAQDAPRASNGKATENAAENRVPQARVAEPAQKKNEPIAVQALEQAGGEKVPVPAQAAPAPAMPVIQNQKFAAPVARGGLGNGVNDRFAQLGQQVIEREVQYLAKVCDLTEDETAKCHEFLKGISFKDALPPGSAVSNPPSETQNRIFGIASKPETRKRQETYQSRVEERLVQFAETELGPDRTIRYLEERQARSEALRETAVEMLMLEADEQLFLSESQWEPIRKSFDPATIEQWESRLRFLLSDSTLKPLLPVKTKAFKDCLTVEQIAILVDRNSRTLPNISSGQLAYGVIMVVNRAARPAVQPPNMPDVPVAVPLAQPLAVPVPNRTRREAP